MFTIKAVTEARTANELEKFSLYECHHLHLENAPPLNPGDPGIPAAEVVVLEDEANRRVGELYVGDGQFWFNKIYVMNDRGKTVQVIVPSYPPKLTPVAA